MSIYERAQKATLLSRLAETPSWLIFVTGPRQSGKTTLVQQALNAVDRPCLYLAIDAPGPNIDPAFISRDATGAVIPIGQSALPVAHQPNAEWLVRQWERARFEADRSDRGFVLVLDEIQKIPNWSETVKGLWDADRIASRPLHVVLLGSAPLLMQKGLTESLTGRFETIRLSHWSYSEMSAAFGFNLDQYIYFGGYPGAAPLIAEEERWRSYVLGALVSTSIERDVLALQRVDKPILMKRLFDMSAAYSGRELAYNKMLGQLQDAGNTTTLARYLDLMSRVGLVAGLTKYASQPVGRGSTPKLNVLNTALMSASSDYTFHEATADRTYWGRLVESAVGAHLFNTRGSRTGLYYWRDGSNEVDFVLARADRLAAIEVKSGKRRSTQTGFRKFENRFRKSGRAVSRIAVGENDIQLAEFLATPASDWLDSS
ncbi:MAG: ATP-binding protein [Gammaproteobacteria bacterium]|nr:ATP-binding protein [Gammaproteobacteria bacterium]